MNLPLHDVQTYFAKLYGRRNLFVNGSLPERALHMTRRIGRLADAERKSERMPGRLARAFSYFMSVVNYFGGELDLARGMMAKFPSYGCCYCHKKPCDCLSGHRPAPIEREPDVLQFKWTIHDWQKHLFEVYGPNNLKRGFWEVHGRLSSEFGELGILNIKGPDTPITPDLILKECELEAADVFSWIIAIAYIKGIDLQDEVEKRYKACPGCHKVPCDCPVVFLSPDGKFFSTVGTDRYTSTT
ncbi:MAG: hypothetical protein M3Q63_00375 [bacterium]|nr:hypothetical protein [bacterium]